MKPLNIKVLIGPSTFGRQSTLALERLKGAGCEVIDNPYKRKLKKDELMTLLSHDVQGLIAGLERLDREVLENSVLKVISRSGSGLSNVDLEAAKDLSIRVCYTPDAPTTSVAEITLGAMISLLRQIPQMNTDLHRNTWRKVSGVQLEGKCVAIIGFGRIGRKVASLLKPFNVKILAVDPGLSKISKKSINDVETCSLNQALTKADIITIHAGTEDQIIGSSEFERIKKGAFLLNGARGAVINEEALIRALEDKKIKGAWIDTFDIEPYSGPLQNYSQVLLTPHIGSYTLVCRRNMELKAVNNLIDTFKEINNA